MKSLKFQKIKKSFDFWLHFSDFFSYIGERFFCSLRKADKPTKQHLEKLIAKEASDLPFDIFSLSIDILCPTALK